MSSEKTEYDTQEKHAQDTVNLSEDSPEDEFVYEPQQFTWRAAIVGSILGCVVAASNLYLGLKIGWTFGASLWGAIFGFLIIKFIAKITGTIFGPKENATCQAAATAAGGLSSGFVTAIPALYRLGLMGENVKSDLGTLYVWTLASAFFGMFYAVPLRTHFVINQNLVFPTPRAAAETIKSLHRAGSDAAVHARMTGIAMAISFVVAMLFVIIGFFIPGIFSVVHILYYIGMAAGYTQLANADAIWGWNFSWDFSFFGAGLMTPFSTVYSFFLGSVIAFGIVGPVMVDKGEFSRPFGFPKLGNNPSAQSWFLWPGIALMVITAFSELAVHGKTIAHAVVSGVHALRNLVRKLQKKDSIENTSNYVSKDTVPAHEQIPTTWWVGGLIVSAIISIVIMKVGFDVPVYATIGALILSFLLAFVGLQASGETDINPTGAVGKVTQLVFSRIPSDSIDVIRKTNLMCANISSSVCAQSVDMVGDLKTGHLIGASPRSQFWAQCVGSVFAVVIAVPLFMLYTSAYPCILKTPTEDEKCPFATPAVTAWQNVTLILTGGGTIPKGSLILTIVLAVVAALNVFVREKFLPDSWKPYWINLNAVGLGFINPSVNIPLAMAIGYIAGQIWKRVNKLSHERMMYAVSAGFIAGVGIAGIINAFMTLAGVEGGDVQVGCGIGEDHLC